ncbi:MAG: PBP1A family penicillin-binding protein [Alphaproteobacteria bacterium]|nr:PBP1A family penicillin-binding protein [Alphaproteobacteria bacterium]
MAKKTTRKSAKKASKKARKKFASKQKGGWFAALVKFAFKWGFVSAIWLGLGLALLLFWYTSELPNITKSMVFERRPTIIIKASNGEVVDRYGDLKGKIVDVTTLPSHVTQAVLAIEDRRFYDHFGMDLKGIARAFVVNIRHGGFVQGGSTITQQLAKNLFLSRERTIKRKIQELILAFQLESELTKDEILSAYLNRVYLGNGAYGIDAAARAYFNKSAHELNVREAATIAGLLKAPSRYSPSANPTKSAQRTKVVLNAMIEANYIAEDEIDKYRALPPAPRRKPSSGESVRYFTDYVVRQIEALIGPIEEDILVETTLNQNVQDEMEQALTKAILRYGTERNVEQGAGIVLRLDGAVVALMGGKDYGTSEFNRVIDSVRPPGSSFKPIVYLAAIENGWDLNSLIVDEPIEKGRYRPKNFGHEYYGEVTLYEALTLSLNTVAVNLMREVGPDQAIGLARRLGITAHLEPDLSLALGSTGVPMIQMATSYAALGRGGMAVEPYAIRRITTKNGDKVLYEYQRPRKARQVVATSDVKQLTAMMQSVILNGTGRAAITGFPVAGKTGTSQDFRDAWFIGFSSKYAGAIWMGNDDNSPTKRLTGGSGPAQVWREVMSTAQRQGGYAYNNFSEHSMEVDVEAEGFETGGFDNLLERILHDAEMEEENSFGSILDWLSGNSRSRRIPEGEEFTPLGRHQWDVNE